MLFSSLTFIFAFLPLILIFYYLSPKNIKNYVLLIFSLVFYAWGGVSYSLILIFSILFNFLFVKQIGKKTINQKRWLITGLIFNIIVLVTFKYLDFFIENLNGINSFFIKDFKAVSKTNILLPLGISFFTFQQMSLLWDVYRNQEKQKLTFINTALYIGFFPQLIAGPIVRYNDIINQIKKRKETIILINSGIQKFILGLFKKIVFANTCASIADSIMDKNITDINTPIAWLGIVAYTLQIYFDFSGYSDMAIGLGRMFGFRIQENFNFPYISKSIKEFWRRWHISLSSWFRDYLYIPLGGNRKGIKRTYLNLFIVFVLTGFWHGATWSFVFWGVFHGTFLIIEKIGFDKILKRLPKIINWTYTMLIVLIGWVFFRIENITDAYTYVGQLFGFGTSNNVNIMSYLNDESIFILALALISCSTIFLKIKNFAKRYNKDYMHLPLTIVKNSILIFMLLYSVMYINSGSYNPFIYFRF